MQNLFTVILAIGLFGCSPATLQMADDIVQGEATVAGKVMADMGCKPATVSTPAAAKK